MIEPTETEPRERLDEFCEAMLAIARGGCERPRRRPRRPAHPAGRPAGRGEGGQARGRAVRLRRTSGLSPTSRPPSRPCRRASRWTAASANGSWASTSPAGCPLREQRAGRVARGRPDREPARRQAAARRMRNFSPSVEGYARSVVGPPAYAQRLRQIEEEIDGASRIGCVPRGTSCAGGGERRP